VEYGKRHAMPTLKAPPSGRNRGRGSFTTTNDTLVAWVREEYDAKQNQWHNFQYFIYDKAGSACVQTYGRNYGGSRRGNQIVAVQFDAFPRRQGKFYLRAQEQGNGGQEMSEDKFVIHNPARGPLTKWTPEALPVAKADDDVSVTLKKLSAGADMSYQRNQDNPDDAANKGVQAVFHVERNGKPVANWQPVAVETSDATGNHVSGWINGNQWQDNDDTVTYQYALWPDEPAWKMRFEFSQQSDFSPGELWAVSKIPVQPGRSQDFWNYSGRRNSQTNVPFGEAVVNGYNVKVFPVKHFTDMGPNSQPQGGLIIQTDPSLKAGWRMTLVKLADDQGFEIGHWDYGTYNRGASTTYRYGLQELGDATNLNLTLALHKSRFVEFTVKPQMAPPAADAAQ
jgi:hypothetical protein